MTHADRKALLELESRRMIYTHVVLNPGQHLRGIANALSMPLGTALYHLECLNKAGLVTRKSDGRYKRHYPTREHSLEEKQEFFLIGDVPFSVFSLANERPGLNADEMTEYLKFPMYEVNPALIKLEELELLESKPGEDHKKLFYPKY